MAGLPAIYGMVIARNIMVPMRDGVRLATDIFYPALEGKPLDGQFPAILGRTSYDKKTYQMWIGPVAEFFTPRGYVVVLQDLRGRQDSEGTGQYFHTATPTEGADGHDTIEWIAAQPWSNGRVGMVGSSHGAIVQQVAALHRPPHLSAIWPDVGPINSYHHQARGGGAMQLHMFGAQFLHAHDAQEIRDDPVAQQRITRAMSELRDWVWRTPFKSGLTPLAAVPNLEKTLFDYYYRGEYDDYWKHESNDQERHFHRHADVPGVYSSGWYDPYAVAVTRYFAAMAKQNQTPQRLIMGPWNHVAMRGVGSTAVGRVDFGAAARWGDAVYNAERIRWFDRWLKDVPTGVEEDPPVRLFVMGGGSGRRTREGLLDHGGRWRSEREWPIARMQPTPYYLGVGGTLSPAMPTADTASASFSFDPSHPVPTLGGAVTGFYEMVPVPVGMNPAYVTPRARMRSIVLDGPMHQQEEPGIIGCQLPYPLLAVRPDVLVFQTEPLPAGVEITGEIIVNVWISSSAVDTDFTAKLIDVYPPNEDYPDGYHLNLVDYIIRTRYRNSWEHAELMTPGEVYRVQIELPPISNLFAPGHRIRLDISSSNFPRFDINPNTGEPVGRHTRQVAAHNTVYFDRQRPSHALLSIIPPGGEA